MAKPLRFHPKVAADLRQGIHWYRETSRDLANRFRRTIDAGFDAIGDHPELYSVAFDDVRFYRTKVFPYLILYRLVRGTPFVLGVFHGASDPESWRRRAR